MKHKWYKEIQAWSEGAEIEEFAYGVWEERDQPRWHLNYQYRIKPQPKQPKYLYVYYRDKVYFLQDKDASNRYYIGKIEVQDD
jgi:hypothetical protein